MADEIEVVKFRVSIEFSLIRTYDEDDVEVEVRKDLLDEKGKLTRDALLDWLDAVGRDEFSNYHEDVDYLSFSVQEG